MTKGSLRNLAVTRGELLNIDPRIINVKSDWNNRDFTDPANIEHVDNLAASIAQNGVREPLKVFMEDGKVYLTNGECRLRAVMKLIEGGLDIKSVPVLGEDRYANEADRVFSQITSNSGKPFTPLEQAKTFKRLLSLGWQAKDIAEKSGISAARVSQVLDLLTLPEPIKQMVTTGQVSATMAVSAVKDHNPEQAVKILQDAIVEAQANGRSRALPKDAQFNNPEAKPPSNKLKAIVTDAFEYSDVDDSADDVVVIKMPPEHWEKIRKACKL